MTECPLASPDHHPIRHQDTHTSIPLPPPQGGGSQGTERVRNVPRAIQPGNGAGIWPQAVLAVEPEVPIIVQPPVPLLPPSGLPSMLWPAGHSPELSAGSGTRRPSGPGSGAGSPAHLLTLACLTTLFITCTGPRSQRYPTQNTLNWETGSKALCGKIGKEKKVLIAHPSLKPEINYH